EEAYRREQRGRSRREVQAAAPAARGGRDGAAQEGEADQEGTEGGGRSGGRRAGGASVRRRRQGAVPQPFLDRRRRPGRAVFARARPGAAGVGARAFRGGVA